MIGSEIVALFESLIDDSLDSTLEYQLLNGARKKVEAERDWEFLKKLDNSKSAVTTGIDLPSDWMRTLAVYVGTIRYHQIPFEQQVAFANSAYRWYLDIVNNKLYLIGSGISGTVNHFYIYGPDDVDADTPPVWPMSHELIAYEMAELYFAIDQGEQNFSWDRKHAMEKALYKQALVNWNADVTRRAVENSLPEDMESEIDLGLM